MSDTVRALLFGVATVVPLVVGAWIGLRWKLAPRVLAALMAFGAGTMIAAVSEEMFAPAYKEVGGTIAGPALLLGAATYVIADHLLETKLGQAALGLALLLGVILDGIPENAALGVSLDETTAGIALLVAIAVGNFPEAVAGSARMRDQHKLSTAKVFLLWGVTAVVLLLTVPAAEAAASHISDQTIAAIEAFAGGAVIAVLADSLMPEAYREGGWWVGLATALGFLVSFQLG